MTTEHDATLALARRVLDRVNADPDDDLAMLARQFLRAVERNSAPIPMVLHCPHCRTQHIDRPEPEKDWENPPHKSHLCRLCGYVWRPADIATTGVIAIETRGTADGEFTFRDKPGPPLTLKQFRALLKGFEPPSAEVHLADGPLKRLDVDRDVDPPRLLFRPGNSGKQDPPREVIEAIAQRGAHDALAIVAAIEELSTPGDMLVIERNGDGVYTTAHYPREPLEPDASGATLWEALEAAVAAKRKAEA